MKIDKCFANAEHFFCAIIYNKVHFEHLCSFKNKNNYLVVGIINIFTNFVAHKRLPRCDNLTMAATV